MLALQEICEKEGLNFGLIQQNYLNNRGIWPEKLLNLTPEQRKYLTSPEVNLYLKEKVLTFDEAVNLTLEQIRTLAEEERPLLVKFAEEGLLDWPAFYFIGRIKESNITEEELLKLTPEHRKYLTSYEVYLYFLTLDESVDLTKEQIRALAEERDPLLAKCAQEGLSLLDRDRIEGYINEGLITEEEFLSLTPQRRKYLASDEVKTYLREKVLTLEEAISLTEEQVRASVEGKNPLLVRCKQEGWEYSNIRNYIHQENTTEAAFLKLTPEHRKYLASEEVKEYLEGNVLTWAQAVSLTQEEIRALANEKIPLKAKCIQEGIFYIDIKDYNEKGNITEATFLDLTTPEHRKYLTSEEVKSYLKGRWLEEEERWDEEKLLTWEEAISLNQEQIRALVEKKSPLFARCAQEDLHFNNLKYYITEGFITEEEILNLRSGQRRNLANDAVVEHIKEGLMTFGQARGLKHGHVARLEKNYWRQVEGVT